MRSANTMRLVISYLLLMAAFAVYFFWHFFALELILIAAGFIILISALSLHNKDKKNVALAEIAENGEEEEVDPDEIPNDDEEEAGDEIAVSVIGEPTPKGKKTEHQSHKEEKSKELENFEEIKEIWDEVADKK